MGWQLLVTDQTMSINWWRALFPRIGSTNWLQGTMIFSTGFIISQTPPPRYPLREDLHDIYTNAMTVY